jgi:hypothetical protein
MQEPETHHYQLPQLLQQPNQLVLIVFAWAAVSVPAVLVALSLWSMLLMALLLLHLH